MCGNVIGNIPLSLIIEIFVACRLAILNASKESSMLKFEVNAMLNLLTRVSIRSDIRSVLLQIKKLK